MNQVRVIIIDDHAIWRGGLRSWLSGTEFDIIAEGVDGQDAVPLAKEHEADLLLMDIRMPRLDGVGATRQIRAMPKPIGCIPIIALTANADADETASYLGAGMNGVVEKPMKPDQLLQVVRDTLAQPQLDASAAA